MTTETPLCNAARAVDDYAIDDVPQDGERRLAQLGIDDARLSLSERTRGDVALHFGDADEVRYIAPDDLDAILYDGPTHDELFGPVLDKFLGSSRSRRKVWFRVMPRYTPGSPAMVGPDIADRVARQERDAYAMALTGAMGDEELATAKATGLT